MAHDVDTAIQIILKHRQAFCAGVVGIHTLTEIGEENAEPMKPLATRIEPDLVHAGFYLPKMRWNTQMERATANRLGMQLIAGTGDAIKHCKEYKWKESGHDLFQFLRQVRNAAAHDNRIQVNDSFVECEWKGFNLTQEMGGERVFTDISEPLLYDERVEELEGFFESGDALSLVTDVLDLIVDDSTYDRKNIQGIPNEKP